MGLQLGSFGKELFNGFMDILVPRKTIVTDMDTMTERSSPSAFNYLRRPNEPVGSDWLVTPEFSRGKYYRTPISANVRDGTLFGGSDRVLAYDMSYPLEEYVHEDIWC